MAQSSDIEKPVTMEVSNLSIEKTPALVDSAHSFLVDAGEVDYNASEEKALIRKVDALLMPFLAAVYFLQFLDKNLSRSFGIRGRIAPS
jgi:hypothetical protein